MDRGETWLEFCNSTATRLSIETLQLFKAHLNDNPEADKPGCALEFLEYMFKFMRKKFQWSLSQHYFDTIKSDTLNLLDNNQGNFKRF